MPIRPVGRNFHFQTGGKMIDKGLEIFLMLLFGPAGITIVILAWAQPMPVAERILTTSVGSIGLFGVLIRLLLFRSTANMDAGKVPASEKWLDKDIS